jgi:hypothetical protein
MKRVLIAAVSPLVQAERFSAENNRKALITPVIDRFQLIFPQL